MTSSHDGNCSRDLLQGLVAGSSTLVCADLYFPHAVYISYAAILLSSTKIHVTSRIYIYSMVSHLKALHNYVIPARHREYSGQKNQWYKRAAPDGNIQRLSCILISCIFYGMI